MIKESTYFLSSSIPSAALLALLLPSNVKGRVTTATVKAPSSFAIFATRGAAPVPVPPPIPAVMKTISAPLTASRISFSDSSAALRPYSGFPPAPSPLVVSLPKTILFSAGEFFITCTSVLQMKKSTPLTPSATMRFTALLPPPPTPKTLIFAT